MELEGAVSKRIKINTETNILDLPNECLAAIFHHLPFLSFFSTHETCKRFRVVSEYSFPKKYKAFEITSCGTFYYIACPDGIYSNEKRTDANEMRKYFQCFGNCIESLKICNVLNITELMDILNTNGAANLRHLDLGSTDSLDIDIDRLDDFAKIFGQLEKLELSYLSNDDIREILKQCVNLKELSIIAKNIYDKSILFNITPKIESILYYYHYKEKPESILSSEDTCKFLKTHPNLKSVRILNMNLSKPNMKYLENIEMLLMGTKKAIDFDKMDWIRLFQLKSLKRLELNSTGKNISNVFSEIQSKPPTDIEEYTLNLSYFRDVYCLLNAFTFRKLRKLVFSFKYDRFINLDLITIENQVKYLAKNLVNVEELHFFFVQTDWIPVISYFVKYFKNLRLLTLYNYCSIVTIEQLRQIANAQPNKNNRNDKLIVKYNESKDNIVEQTLEKDLTRFSNGNYSRYNEKDVLTKYICFSMINEDEN